MRPLDLFFRPEAGDGRLGLLRLFWVCDKRRWGTWKCLIALGRGRRLRLRCLERQRPSTCEQLEAWAAGWATRELDEVSRDLGRSHSFHCFCESVRKQWTADCIFHRHLGAEYMPW